MNNSTNFLMMLENSLDLLTDQEKKIAGYLLVNSKNIAHLSSQSLADKCFVSRPTLSRFIKKLGLSTYAELKFLLKDTALRREQEHFSAVIQEYHDYIDQIFQNQSMDRLAEVIMNADTIFLYGTGNEQKLEVEFMRHLFSDLGLKVVVFFDRGEYDYVKEHFKATDILFTVSYKGENKSCISMIMEAQAKSVATVALTRTSQNTLIGLADYQLFVPTDSLEVNTRRTYEIAITFYFIIEQLYLACKKFGGE